MELNVLVSIVTVLVTLQLASCKPLNKQPPPPQRDPSKAEDKETGLEYDRYLKQVVDILESDDGFRKKLETANISDIKSGAIAMHLPMVNRTIRTRLNEIKRMEVQRLQQLARMKMRSRNAGGKMNDIEVPRHLDLRNPHSFEIKDLETLILKTTNDLEGVDEQRKEEFKQYEMEKEFEYKQKLEQAPDGERVNIQQQHDNLQKKHMEHEKIQHPGSKDQFEEVWEKKDNMAEDDFNPKTFFMMHDLNADLFWDIEEVEAVLQTELEKVYDARNSPEEDDPLEKEEEMNRMREHIFTEIDQDRDLMISIQEFLEYTGKQGENKKFAENEGWESLDDKTTFTDEEYQQYLNEHHPQPGVVPPPVDRDLQFAPEEQLHQQQQQQFVQQQRDHQGMPLSQQGMPPQEMHRQEMPQHGMPQQGMPPQEMPQHGMPQQGMPSQEIQGVAQQGMPQVHQQAVPQQEMHQPAQDFPQGQKTQEHAQPVQGHPDSNQPHEG